MDATTALLVQGCACAPAAHAAVTAAMTSATNLTAGAPTICDAGPDVEFDTLLEQMAGQLQTPEPRYGAEPTVAAEASKRNGHGARVTCADPELDMQPAQDDDGNDDGDEDVDGPVTAAYQQMAMMAAGSAGTAPVQTRAPRHPTPDRTDNRATGQVEDSRSGSLMDEIAMQENASVSAERLAEGRSVDEQDRMSQQSGSRSTVQSSAGRLDGQVDGSRNRLRASELVGRDERMPNGSPRSMNGPVTESHVVPQVQERTAAAAQKRETAGPERRTPEGAHMAVDHMNDLTAGQVDGTQSTTLAAEMPVREHVVMSMERLIGSTGRTVTQVEPKNVHTAAPVERDAPVLNDSSRSIDGSVTEPDVVPQVQEHTVAVIQERSTTRPVTADPEQLAEGRSAGKQDRVSQQPGDHTPVPVHGRASQPEGAHMVADLVNDPTVGQVDCTTSGPRAGEAPVSGSTSASMAQPKGDAGHTAIRVESKNVHTAAPVERDEPVLNGSSRPMDGPVTEPDVVPQVQEHTVAVVRERSMIRPEGRSTVLTDIRGTADADGNTWVVRERPAVIETEELVTTELERYTPARAEGRAPIGESAPVIEPGGIMPEMVDLADGKADMGDTAEPRQTALRPIAPRKEGTMTASRVVTGSRGWPEALVRSALVESLARHRNLPNPLWDEGSEKVKQAQSQPEQKYSVSSTSDHAEHREPAPVARPELAVAGDPVVAAAPVEGHDVSQTSQAGRPVLTEQAGSSVMRQIASHVSARAAQGGGVFRARLVPEHLGSVEVRVRVVRGICTADIRADDAEIARFIESHSSDLKVSLAEHGVDLAGLSVSSRSRAQEGWSAAVPAHFESDWSGSSWNGANARQQYAAAAFAGGGWGHGRGERRGAPTQSGPGVTASHHAAMQSGSPSSDEPIMARWARGYTRIDYLA
ncbi:MAG TPA: flagellar hook-length control protein FliK [Bacillota bacterium]|nr:flagellar hook-length control protein FliK [Bacillota bacterium]